jgi:hypothetical protein
MTRVGVFKQPGITPRRAALASLPILLAFPAHSGIKSQNELAICSEIDLAVPLLLKSSHLATIRVVLWFSLFG